MPAAVETVTEDELAPGSALVIGLGGDGTILRALKLATEHEVPVLGVNLGRLAFLAEVNLDDLPAALDQIDRGDFRMEERATMRVDGHDRRAAADRVQRLRALARSRPRPGGARRRGRGRRVRALHDRRAGDRDADRLDRVLVRGRRADRLAAPPRAAGDAGGAARGVRPRRVPAPRRAAARARARPLGAAAAGGRRAARGRGAGRATASSSRSPSGRPRCCGCTPHGFYEKTRRKLQLTDSSELAPAGFETGAGASGAGGRLLRRSSSARRSRSPRSSPIRGARPPARCCSTAARRARSTSPTRAG